jgi:hypothetical protein
MQGWMNFPTPRTPTPALSIIDCELLHISGREAAQTSVPAARRNVGVLYFGAWAGSSAGIGCGRSTTLRVAGRHAGDRA